MTFKSSCEHVAHVITYPSLWLSDQHTLRVLVLGVSEQQVAHDVNEIQTGPVNQNISMYVSEWDGECPQQLDWLLFVRGMCTHIMCEPQNWAHVAVCMNHPGVTWLTSDQAIMQKLISLHQDTTPNLTQAVWNLFNQKGYSER